MDGHCLQALGCGGLRTNLLPKQITMDRLIRRNVIHDSIDAPGIWIGPCQPPRNMMAASAHTTYIAAYSDMKKKANRMPEYSV